MRFSGVGAAVGAVVGAAARGTIVLWHLGDAATQIPALLIPSATIGLLVGGIAGATGKPLRGAVVGAILSGLVFEVFMLPCVSIIGLLFSQSDSTEFWRGSLSYALEMALAGAVAGGVGGGIGLIHSRTRAADDECSLDKADSPRD